MWGQDSRRQTYTYLLNKITNSRQSCYSRNKGCKANTQVAIYKQSTANIKDLTWSKSLVTDIFPMIPYLSFLLLICVISLMHVIPVCCRQGSCVRFHFYRCISHRRTGERKKRTLQTAMADWSLLGNFLEEVQEHSTSVGKV